MTTDPVCGMDVAENSEYRSNHGGENYNFCSDSCLSKFEAAPGQYIKTVSMKDPVCGMDINESAEFHVEHGGKTVYFCSDSCLGKFTESPSQYA